MQKPVKNKVQKNIPESQENTSRKGNEQWDEGQETGKKGNQNWDDNQDTKPDLRAHKTAQKKTITASAGKGSMKEEQLHTKKTGQKPGPSAKKG